MRWLAQMVGGFALVARRAIAQRRHRAVAGETMRPKWLPRIGRLLLKVTGVSKAAAVCTRLPRDAGAVAAAVARVGIREIDGAGGRGESGPTCTSNIHWPLPGP
jgi:hypothetical protein